MLQKWKHILTNWINCYCNENDNNEISINLDSILEIISHLHKNFNLDESRSSLLDAQTIQEFILEKYPSFTFENGTCEPSTEEDLFLSASLLLYFLCVNSKNIDLKNAMCSKLSTSDQEVILKFSQKLMSCSYISASDVLMAITEACGHEITGNNAAGSTVIAETPPALRSLHGEVRRLQAALDAERFDRNYLQEELSRTNLKLENLSKLKEQYKLEILNLKAQISECCGGEKEINRNDGSNNNIIKISKQLELTEERLAAIQEELSDVNYERDTYKSKLDDLKRDRDKYLALSQKEHVRACELADKLEDERQQCNAVKELLAELRQHNRLNGLNASQLECDDLDASLHSLPHNSSVCSEACANVIEVQLSEERAKIVTLKHEIQMLQDQLNDLNNKYDNEKRIFNDIVSEKDSNITNLKHRVNEEIEKYNIMKSQYEDDKTKTNNEINELEQTLKDITENTRKNIEIKVEEIQTLQEEKLSLLQSFSNETTKMENIIQDLKSEVEIEKCSKQKMRDDYENQFMKLNEKILNRNNELVELQNKIVKHGEEIEELQLQLREEKDMRQELINKHNTDVLYYNDKVKELSESVQIKSDEINHLRKEIQSLASEKDKYVRDKETMQHELDEKNETVNSLRTQLQTEIEYKNNVQNKLSQLETANEFLSKEIDRLNEDLSKTVTDNFNISKLLKTTEMNLVEEKGINEKLKNQFDDLTNKMENLLQTVEQKENTISLLENEIKVQRNCQERITSDFESERILFKKKFAEIELLMKDQKLRLTEEIEEHAKCKDSLQCQIKELEILSHAERQNSEMALNKKNTELESVIKGLNEIKDAKATLEDNLTTLQKDIIEKSLLLESLLSEKYGLLKVIEQNSEAKKMLEDDISVLEKKQDSLINKHESAKNEFGKKIAKLESTLEEEKNNFKSKLIEEQKTKDLLQTQINNLEELVESEKVKAESTLKEKLKVLDNILEELNTIKNENVTFSENITKLQADIVEKSLFISNLINEKNELTNSLDKSKKANILLEEEIKLQQEKEVGLVKMFESEKLEHKNMVAATQALMAEQNQTLNNDILKHTKTEAILHEKVAHLETLLNTERHNSEMEIKTKAADFNITLEELNIIKKEKSELQENVLKLKNELSEKTNQFDILVHLNTDLYKKIDDNNEVLILLENETILQKESREKLTRDFDTERLELQNNVRAIEMVMEEERSNNNKKLSEKVKSIEILQNQIKDLESIIETDRHNADIKMSEKVAHYDALVVELTAVRDETVVLHENIKQLQKDIAEKTELIDSLMNDKKELTEIINKNEEEIQKINAHVKTTLSFGLTNIVESLKNDEISVDIIQRLQHVNNSNVELESSLDIIVQIIIALSKELKLKQALEEALQQENTAVEKMTNIVKQKDQQVSQLQEEIRNLHKTHETSKIEFLNQTEEYKTLLEVKEKDIENLQMQNESLHNEHNNVTVQLDTKIHSLLDKLINNENLTEKLKTTYECQIDNLNIMVTKLTNYLKEKTIEVDTLRNEKEHLLGEVDKSTKAIESLEEELKVENCNREKLIDKFESERLVLKNMVTVTESVMEDQKMSLNNKILEYVKMNEQLNEQVKYFEDSKEEQNNKIKECIGSNEELKQQFIDLENINEEERINHNNKLTAFVKINEELQEQIENLQVILETERQDADIKVKEKDAAFNIVLKELAHIKEENDILKQNIRKLEKDSLDKITLLEDLSNEKSNMETLLEKHKLEIASLERHENEEIEKEKQIVNEVAKLRRELDEQFECHKKLEALRETIEREKDELVQRLEEKNVLLESEKMQCLSQAEELDKLQKLQTENISLNTAIKEMELEIVNMKEEIKNKSDENYEMRENNRVEKINLVNKCDILQEYQSKAEEELAKRQMEIDELQYEVKKLQKQYINIVERNTEKDEVVERLSKELEEARKSYSHMKSDIQKKDEEINEVKEKLNKANCEVLDNLRKENELLLKAASCKCCGPHKEKLSLKYSEQVEMQNQVYDSAIDNTPTSLDSCKTITDLEKIIQEKNRTITALLSDVTYLKTIIAESENKLLDVTKDFELSKENCHQLSCQLKKIVHQKNEEISELKNQITKMCATENRASQIIKVSAKYHAIILKRIAEIKNNTVLKELTNFGNSNVSDNELRRSLNAGAITMEDLENFLETTDRHLRRCSEKQITLQKERDRLAEIKHINDTEIISMRKFLTELSVSIKTFNSVKDLYSQKLSRVISIQRTVRREILSLDGQVTDATMCKLERGYAAAMQDLSECTLNLERWVDRSICRSISSEKIKQAFMSDVDRESLVPTTFQNTSLEIQLGELESSFQKLLEEVIRAQKGEGAKDEQALTVMEVRAEYEDKLNRMKAKMKQLYTEQTMKFKEQQSKEVEALEQKLRVANEKMQETSRAYEEHIRGLTAELWNVGEKFIIQKDEAQWLRKKQKSGSLMSLQHVHSSGLVAPPEEPCRQSDAHSLRSLPVTTKKETKDGRGLHMSDEEGEVFDNRFLRELSTPRRAPPPAPGARLSELRWRNSLCPPHLKSSYPAETQFAATLHEEEIKCAGTLSMGGKQRKEVGITAYKKPGPPTPSKQAGRLSATDSELRESLRVEAEPSGRRTGTPSRLFGLFRGSRHDTLESTPRARRLSNIFRKK